MPATLICTRDLEQTFSTHGDPAPLASLPLRVKPRWWQPHFRRLRGALTRRDGAQGMGVDSAAFPAASAGG